MNIVQTIANELNVKSYQVEKTIELIDSGNTIPFIARYRKEVTGGLSDETLRSLDERLKYLRNLEERKGEVKTSIENQGKLTDEIIKNLEIAQTLAEVEDIYRPYKQKKKTRATVAKANGLEPLAQIIKEQKETKPIEEIAKKYLNENVQTVEDAVQGAKDIIAEEISDDPEFRKQIKKMYYREGFIVTKSLKEENPIYNMYNDFKEKISTIPSHRILAINRGEKEEFLKVSIDKPVEKILEFIEKNVIKNLKVKQNYVKEKLNNKITSSNAEIMNFQKKEKTTQSNNYEKILKETVEDSFKRLIEPSVDREIRADLTEKADKQAIEVFGKNAKQLLLGAPIKGLTVLGFDPAYRTGCKLAVIDETGKVLDTGVIYPTEPQNDIEGSEKELIKLIVKDNIQMIAIGNGTASRESENFVANTLKKVKETLHKDVYYTIVSEAGASVYSASKLASEEYPDLNVSLRGAISIARRLQDPLAEFVKIDPKAIGIGQYQHDVDQKKLSESLEGVVEDAVNTVGVDVNTATPSLLSYVSGINKTIAKNIVKYRDENGTIKERKELLKVPKLGKVAYEQCAGFIRIPNGKNPLENTGVHPESYEVAEELLKSIGFTKEDLLDKEKLSKIKAKLNEINIKELSNKLNVGEITFQDIIKELSKPGRDPREDMPKPILRNDVLKFEDLREGMILTGTVRNITDFGAFVDVGVKHDGLVHISEISDKYVKRPSDVVSIGDIVKVKVIGIDNERQKVKLSMRGL